MTSVRALTQPITTTEIPEVLRKGDRIQHPVQVLPQDLEERNYDGKLFFFLYIILILQLHEIENKTFSYKIYIIFFLGFPRN